LKFGTFFRKYILDCIFQYNNNNEKTRNRDFCILTSPPSKNSTNHQEPVSNCRKTTPFNLVNFTAKNQTKQLPITLQIMKTQVTEGTILNECTHDQTASGNTFNDDHLCKN